MKILSSWKQFPGWRSSTCRVSGYLFQLMSASSIKRPCTTSSEEIPSGPSGRHRVTEADVIDKTSVERKEVQARKNKSHIFVFSSLRMPYASPTDKIVRRASLSIIIIIIIKVRRLKACLKKRWAVAYLEFGTF